MSPWLSRSWAVALWDVACAQALREGREVLALQPNKYGGRRIVAVASLCV